MRQRLLFLAAAIMLLIALPAVADNTKNEKPFVIPELREWQGGKGTLTINAETKIVYKKGDAQMEKIARRFAADIKEMFGYEVEVAAGKASKGWTRRRYPLL